MWYGWGPLHQLVQMVICAFSFSFFLFRTRANLHSAPHPFVRTFPTVLPQLEKTKTEKKKAIMDKVWLLPLSPLMPYLMFGHFLRLHSDYRCFHSAELFNQRPTLPSQPNKTYHLHYITSYHITLNHTCPFFLL